MLLGGKNQTKVIRSLKTRLVSSDPTVVLPPPRRHHTPSLCPRALFQVSSKMAGGLGPVVVTAVGSKEHITPD